MVAILFPWAILFANDNPLGGFLALAMQATIIGWIPAVIWAWKTLDPSEEEKPATPNPTPKNTKATPTKSAKGSK